MQEKHLYWPPTFFLGHAVTPQFFHCRTATAYPRTATAFGPSSDKLKQTNCNEFLDNFVMKKARTKRF